jgi:hypothetical protein
MELVEGDDLSVIIARHAGAPAPAVPRGIPLADALPIARQIADGPARMADGRYLLRAASAKASKYFCSDGPVEWY